MKNNYIPGQRSQIRHGLLVRLLTVIVMLSVVTTGAYAQPDTLDVDFRDQTLEQAVEYLKQHTGYDFIYRRGLLPSDSRVNMNAQNATVEQILRTILPSDLSFSISDNVVVINRAPAPQGAGQAQNRFTISGSVYELNKEGARVPLPFAAVVLEGQPYHAVTDHNGQFSITNVPRGQYALNVSMLGKITVSREIDLTGNLSLDIPMVEENFRVRDIVVTATNSKAGESTSSLISRTAIDHLQATSLKDVLSLLPGSLTVNPDLNYMSKLTLRSLPSGDAENMNSMGVSIIVDGAPISNNANMQSLNPTGGNTIAPGGGATGMTGIDARGISTDNIESVEVITGIPSAQYGDVTSGVIVINSKAGHSPLRLNARVNPHTYLFSADAGSALGGNRGFLNYGVDYTHNVFDLTAAYVFYDRATAKFIYSNSFLDNRLNTTTSLDLTYRRDMRKYNPDDAQQNRRSNANEKGFRFTTRGTYDPGLHWWRGLQYTASVDFNAKNGYDQMQGGQLSIYSPAMNDGEVLSNLQDTPITDIDGNVIVPAGEAVTCFTSAFARRYEIKGRELNVFGKLSTNFVQGGERVNNNILVGADIRYAGNPGTGKTFSSKNPYINYSGDLYNSVRPRSYKDIKGYYNLGAYVEDKFQLTFLGGRKFNLQAGVRFDNVSDVGSIFTPRLNASLELIPRVLTLRGGYGITAKMPTLMMLRPEAAYFDYINFNNTNNADIPEAERRAIVTTRVFDTKNHDLEIATNQKAELGLDLRLGGNILRITGYRERMNNGYKFEKSFDTYDIGSFNNYTYADGHFMFKDATDAFLWYNTTTNNLVLNTDGIEFDLTLKRFDAIRTSFSLNGAWMKSEMYYDGYTFYNNSGGINPVYDVGVYDKGWSKSYNERLVTTLRATHNIPQLGFVITLTTQVTWMQKDWRKIGRDVPIQYLSIADNQLYDFPYATREEAMAEGVPSVFRNMVRPSEAQYLIVESLPPLVCFNINVTKEIGDWCRVSFFANNMFRSYPVVRSDRNSSNYIKRNNSFAFGLELQMTIK